MIMSGCKPMLSSKIAKKSKVQGSFSNTDEERLQYCLKSLRCRTWIASGEKVLFGIFSQIGSTSGPSKSPAPSHPQHHTRKRSCQRSLFHNKPPAMMRLVAHNAQRRDIYIIIGAFRRMPGGRNKEETHHDQVRGQTQQVRSPLQ
jgi:hypothetical protein